MFKLIFGILGEIFNAFSPLIYIVLGGIVIFCVIPLYFFIKDSISQSETDRQNKEMERKYEEARRPFILAYYDKAKLEEWKRKAQSGDANAQLVLGGIYLYGANDKDLGMHWLKKAAENGDEAAIKVFANEQRRQQEQAKQEAEVARMVDEEFARRQFVDDVNNLRKGRKLYY